MSNEGNRPTMRQVADAAGVSPMTVSYAFSQPERVAESTRRKVLETAHRLGYSGPHPAARSLRRGRVGSLGVVLGERLTYAFENPQAARFLAGVGDVCAAEGVGLTLVPTTGAPSDAERVAHAVVDGFVVWTTSEDDPVLAAVAASGLPEVVHAGPASHGLPVVGIDDRAAARAMGKVAFARARRAVVLSFPIDRQRRRQLLSEPASSTMTFPVTRSRWEGFRDASVQTGRALRDLQLAVCPGNEAAAAEDFSAELLAGAGPPDAIAAMSDELALGALRAAGRAGIAVPAALAVTGWDDDESAARAGLSTVAQSLRDQGALCAQLVLGQPVDPAQAPWHLVPRESTARPRVMTAAAQLGFVHDLYPRRRAVRYGGAARGGCAQRPDRGRRGRRRIGRGGHGLDPARPSASPARSCMPTRTTRSSPPAARWRAMPQRARPRHARHLHARRGGRDRRPASGASGGRPRRRPGLAPDRGARGRVRGARGARITASSAARAAGATAG